MSLAEELKMLADLRAAGDLSEEEYALAKAQLLRGDGSPWLATSSGTPGETLDASNTALHDAESIVERFRSAARRIHDGEQLGDQWLSATGWEAIFGVSHELRWNVLKRRLDGDAVLALLRVETTRLLEQLRDIDSVPGSKDFLVQAAGGFDSALDFLDSTETIAAFGLASAAPTMADLVLRFDDAEDSVAYALCYLFGRDVDPDDEQALTSPVFRELISVVAAGRSLQPPRLGSEQARSGVLNACVEAFGWWEIHGDAYATKKFATAIESIGAKYLEASSTSDPVVAGDAYAQGALDARRSIRTRFDLRSLDALSSLDSTYERWCRSSNKCLGLRLAPARRLTGDRLPTKVRLSGQQVILQLLSMFGNAWAFERTVVALEADIAARHNARTTENVDVDVAQKWHGTLLQRLASAAETPSFAHVSDARERAALIVMAGQDGDDEAKLRRTVDEALPGLRRCAELLGWKEVLATVGPAPSRPTGASTRTKARTPGEGWMPDPSGRYPDRWWDGKRWTHWVRDRPGGTRSEDPPGALESPRFAPEGWLPDPSGRYPDRWWDGSTWTIWVRDKPGGTRSEDEPGVLPPAFLKPVRTPQGPTSPEPPPQHGRMDTPAAWRADPSGRYQYRYWDGERWTEHVATDGQSEVDPWKDRVDGSIGWSSPED